MKFLSFFCLVCVIMPTVKKVSALALTRRIINGEQASREDVKCLASLWYMKQHPFHKNTNIKHACGGTLIKKQWVLTAAHCFSTQYNSGEQAKKQNWKVKLGVYDQKSNDNVQVRNIARIFKLEYDDRAYAQNDLALLKLDRPVEVNSYVEPCSALDENYCATEGRSCTAMGWGMTVPYTWQGTGATDLPSKVDLKVMSGDSCKTKYPNQTINTNTAFCANDQNTDSTPVGDLGVGDTGGPLFCACGAHGKQFTGLSVGGGLRGNPKWPPLFTQVYAYYPFIKQTISKN